MLSQEALILTICMADVYISDLSHRVINDQTCKIKVQGRDFAPSALSFRVQDQVLSLDLEALWREQTVESKTDEIYVEVTMSRHNALLS